MFQPYTGPTGPTQEQADQNTLTLLQEINNQFPTLKTNVQDLSQRVPVDEGTTEIAVTKENGEKIYVGFDRWGFMLEGNESHFVDQGSMEAVMTEIENWSSK